MSDLSKLTKAQLITVIEESEENKFDNFKEAFGMTYNTDEEWIEFFKNYIEVKKEEIVQEEWRKYRDAPYLR